MLDIALLRKDLDSVLARLAKRKNPQPFARAGRKARRVVLLALA